MPRSESTRRADDRKLRMISTGLGRRRLTDLTVADCDRFLEQCACGLDKASRPITTADQLRRLRATLSAVVRNEIRMGAMSRNVAELAVLPALDGQSCGRRSLTRDELARLLDLASGATLILIDLSGRNALRPAEARAVQWRNVDLDAGLLRVTNQMDANGALAEVKTKDSARTIRLDDSSIERLTRWRARQEETAASALRWDNADGLVVTTRTGSAIDRNNFVRSLTKLCRQAGIEPITPYELRHTAISHQADRGRSSWQIADWAGTSERMISSVYRHQLTQVSDLMPGD
ncbi:MAG: tyrosine-type recombinase/integrase [Acidimicrobiales bacterium]